MKFDFIKKLAIIQRKKSSFRDQGSTERASRMDRKLYWAVWSLGDDAQDR